MSKRQEMVLMGAQTRMLVRQEEQERAYILGQNTLSAKITCARQLKRPGIARQLLNTPNWDNLDAYLEILEAKLPETMTRENCATVLRYDEDIRFIRALTFSPPQRLKNRMHRISGRINYIMGMASVGKAQNRVTDSFEELQQVTDQKIFAPVDHFILAEHYIAQKDALGSLRHLYAAAQSTATQNFFVISARVQLQMRLGISITSENFDTAAYEQVEGLTLPAGEREIKPIRFDVQKAYENKISLLEEEERRTQTTHVRRILAEKMKPLRDRILSYIEEKKIIDDPQRAGSLREIKSLNLSLEDTLSNINNSERKSTLSCNELRHLVFDLADDALRAINDKAQTLNTSPHTYAKILAELKEMIQSLERGVQLASQNPVIKKGTAYFRWGNRFVDTLLPQFLSITLELAQQVATAEKRNHSLIRPTKPLPCAPIAEATSAPEQKQESPAILREADIAQSRYRESQKALHSPSGFYQIKSQPVEVLRQTPPQMSA